MNLPITNIQNTQVCWGYPVSKEAAQKIFCGLGDEWWKQVYDGSAHRYGKMVFDEGLHGGVKEKGYYDSALKAFNYAKEHLCEKPSKEFYCALHKEACAHFKGKENGTEIEAARAGHFRGPEHPGTRSGYRLSTLLKFHERAILNEARLMKHEDYEGLRTYLGDRITEVDEVEQKLHRKRFYSINKVEVAEFESLIPQKVSLLKLHLNTLKTNSVVGKIYPHISLLDGILKVDYATPRFDGLSFEAAVEYLFSEFNRSISEIDAQLLASGPVPRDELVEQKLTLIADLFQKLDWAHSFPDGQGRTDLIFLGKLLSENGFNPAILEDPYISTYTHLADWVEYLKEGMLLWIKLAATKGCP